MTDSVTELRAIPRGPWPEVPWPLDAVHADAGQCGGCGRTQDDLDKLNEGKPPAQHEYLLEWRFTPLDADRRYLEGTVCVCSPCGRRTLQVLKTWLPDLGARPLRGRA